MQISPTGPTTIDAAATTAQPVPRATSQPVPPGDSIARTGASDRHLPHGFPLARIIERAAAAHGIDPKLLAAVGEQESDMGRGAGYDRTTHVGADGHGHGIWQMDDRFHTMRDAVRAGRDPAFAAGEAARQLSENMRAYGTSSGIQRYNGRDTTLPYYHAVMRHLAHIAADVRP